MSSKNLQGMETQRLQEVKMREMRERQTQEIQGVKKSNWFRQMTMMSMMSMVSMTEGSVMQDCVTKDWLSFQVIANDFTSEDGTSNRNERNSQLSNSLWIQEGKSEAGGDE